MSRRPVSVLLLSRTLGSGGTERQLTEIARSMSRSHWQIQVACFNDEGIRARELRDAGLPVFRLPVRSFLSASAVQNAWELRKLIKSRSVSIVHTFDGPAAIFGVPVARASGSPVVLSSQRSNRELRTKAGRRLLRITDRLVDGIVVNCHAVERHLIEDEHVRAERIHVCYNGIDSACFYPDSVSARPPSLESASLVIGTVCVLRPEKGLLVLLRAFSSIRSIRPGLKLVIIGSGPMLPELERLRKELGLENECIFQPAVSDVGTWLRAIDIFVLPSFSEALSNALMEAMACGCCPIASDVGGNPELVEDHKTGLLFPSGNVDELAARLRTVIEQEPLRLAMADAAAEKIRTKFSIAASVARMEEIYSSFL